MVELEIVHTFTIDCCVLQFLIDFICCLNSNTFRLTVGDRDIVETQFLVPVLIKLPSLLPTLISW